MPDMSITGGCQCGAVRYALAEAPTGAHICHCRMCQKAFGSFFAPLAGVPVDAFRLTRGTLAVFRSSDQAERGFCRDCGTPLTFRYVERPRIAISIGSLDAPQRCATLPGLPGERTTEEDAPELAGRIAASNHQHPDHDTPDGLPTKGAEG
jgi:hypothetical protein